MKAGKMMNSNFVLEIKDLSKKYDDFEALKGISLSIERGEIIGLLGPNGAGKTTTIKIITGLLKADGGGVKIFGEDLSGAIPGFIKDKIGVVFEENNLYYRLSALDNLKLFAGINNISRDKVEKLLKEYQLYEVRNKEVKKFSKGMKKRLMICRALLGEPEFLIFDEATGGLDPISAEIIRDKLLDLKKEGKTVLLSTHYLEEADRLCDKVAFLNRGSISAFDRPEVFKGQLSKKFLKLQFSLQKDKMFVDREKEKIGNLLKKGEKISNSGNIITVKLLIDKDVFKRADNILEDYELVEINIEQADLQRVFKEINS